MSAAENDLSVILNTISRALPADTAASPSTSPPISSAVGQEALSAMMLAASTLLASCDSASEDAVERLCSALSSVPAAAASVLSVRDRMAEYDYEAARGLIDELAGMLGKEPS